jgi:L-threonate 2-dehydrogenase
MGWGAAVSLLRAGLPTNGVDVRPEVLQRFEAEGGRGVTTPAEAAAQSNVIFLFVVNAEQAEQVLFGPNGAVATARPGTVFILGVTMPPSTSIVLCERLDAAGMAPIDAPISGGSVKALAGAMTIMALGNTAAFERASPALEAMTLGAKVGIDLAQLYEVICDCAGSSWMFENRGAHIVAGDYTPHSAVDIFVKDLGIVASDLHAANSCGVGFI